MQINEIKTLLFAKNVLILLTKKWAKTIASFRETNKLPKSKIHLRFFLKAQTAENKRNKSLKSYKTLRVTMKKHNICEEAITYSDKFCKVNTLWLKKKSYSCQTISIKSNIKGVVEAYRLDGYDNHHQRI